MRPGGSNAKGAEYERDVCRRLSLWVTDMRSQDIFWRSAGSGGRETNLIRHHRHCSGQSGDVVCIANPDVDSKSVDLGHLFLQLFCVECKYYQNLNLDRIFWGKTGEFFDAWSQALRQATACNRMPLMIAKQNYRAQEVFCTDRTGRSFLRGAMPELKLRVSVHWANVYLFWFADALALPFSMIADAVKPTRKKK